MLHLLRGKGADSAALHGISRLTQHSYCAACTSAYIIEKEEHRCPTCRTEFSGSRESVQRSFYEVIEEDKVVFEEVRTIVLDYLAKYNSRALRTLALR